MAFIFVGDAFLLICWKRNREKIHWRLSAESFEEGTKEKVFFGFLVFLQVQLKARQRVTQRLCDTSSMTNMKCVLC